MKTTAQSDTGAHKDHADVITQPPLIYVPALVAGLLVRFLWQPLRFFPEPWIGHAVGWPLMVACLVLVGWAFRTFSRAGEDPNVREPTSTLVTDGPFTFSRNPMYLTLTVVNVAIALVANTAWPIIFLPATLVAIHYGVILREETLHGEAVRRGIPALQGQGATMALGHMQH